ncbi:MAG: peptidoglycan DD-metalloendopeptidase family protein [Cyclobacteriaceae bacterium]
MLKKIGLALLIGLLGVAVWYWLGVREQQRLAKLEVPIDTTKVVVPEPIFLYGIQVDSFDVFEGKVKWSQNLSSILDNYNISQEQVYQLANASKGVFDVRKLKAGYPYTIIHERDSLKTARQLVFEPDNTQYVIFNLADSVYVNAIERPMITEEVTFTGTVESSVYEAIIDGGASQLLVNKLVDIFAWQVDFFRIQKGDEIRVVYEQTRVKDKVVEVNKILGAYFKHFGKEYYAVYYEQGGQEDYFDEEGNSLRKTFLRAPLNYSRISSRFSPKRFHPVQKRYKAHLGTDYAAPTGTEIRTVGEGVVLEAKYGKYNGNYVKIRHNSNYSTQYLHMSKIARGIRPGVKVKQGQTIGYVGSTGLANGPHLCFRFWKNGRQVDALKVDLPPSEPVDPSKLKGFLHAKNVMMNRLYHLEYVKPQPSQPEPVEADSLLAER